MASDALPLEYAVRLVSPMGSWLVYLAEVLLLFGYWCASGWCLFVTIVTKIFNLVKFCQNWFE